MGDSPGKEARKMETSRAGQGEKGEFKRAATSGLNLISKLIGRNTCSPQWRPPRPRPIPSEPGSGSTRAQSIQFPFSAAAHLGSSDLMGEGSDTGRRVEHISPLFFFLFLHRFSFSFPSPLLFFFPFFFSPFTHFCPSIAPFGPAFPPRSSPSLSPWRETTLKDHGDKKLERRR